MNATREKKPKAALPLSDRTLRSLSDHFKLLADESRLKILLTLARAGEMHVSAICALLKQSQPAVSHHLTLLRMAGFVGYRRDGKFNHYSLDGMNFGELLEKLFADAGKGGRIELGEYSLSYSRTTGKRR